MRGILLILVCVAVSCDSRRAKVPINQPHSNRLDRSEQLAAAVGSVGQVRTDEALHPSHALSKLLFALDPAVGFQPIAPSRPMVTGGVRHAASAPRVPQHPQLFFQKADPTPPPEPEPATFFADGVRTQGRVLGVFGLWASLISYVILAAPGKDAVSQAADAELLNKLIANPFDPTVPAFFSCVFNFMGLWPAWYASVLLPGAAKQNPLPAAPFILGSIFVGAFSLSPYLAVREYRTDGVAQDGLNFVSRWTEGKINAILLSVGAASLFYLGATGNDGNLALSASQYVELFKTSTFGHVMSLDFLLLWTLSYGVLAEDAKRRGLESPSPLYAAVPIIGHMAWLLTRPPLPEK